VADVAIAMRGEVMARSLGLCCTDAPFAFFLLGQALVPVAENERRPNVRAEFSEIT
jgi:hypothetical protein